MASSPDDGTDRQNHDAIQAGKRVKGRGGKRSLQMMRSLFSKLAVALALVATRALMGIVPGVSRLGPPRDQGSAVQLHATWPSSAPVRPFISNERYPRGLREFVSPSEWAVVVGVVDYAIAAGRPGRRVTVANVACVASLVLFLVGLLIGMLRYFVGCTELPDGAPANDSDCTTGKATVAFSVACFCTALWLGCVLTPQLSKAWCAEAAAQLHVEMAEMRSAAPQLQFELENVSALNLSLKISPTREAIRKKQLADKLKEAADATEAGRQEQQKEEEGLLTGDGSGGRRGGDEQQRAAATAVGLSEKLL